MIRTWLLIGIPVILIVLGIIAFFVLKSKKKKFQPDYYILFVLGLVFFVLGIIMENPVMWILGIIFFILGITNKDKWKKRETWKTMNKKQKKLSIILMIVLGILVLGGLVAFLLINSDKIIGGERDEHGCLGAAGYTWNETEQSCIRQWLQKNDSDYYQVKNFLTCADADYPVMESYPRQCRVPNGTIFVEEIENVNDSITGSTVDEEQIEGPYAIIRIIDNESENAE